MSTLADSFNTLGLRGLAAQLDDVLALATKKRWSPAELLEHVADLEAKDRAKRGFERRLARSRISGFKAVADFDWAWPKRIDREALEDALRLDFVRDARNLILVAPPGLGKTTLAKNIAHQAILGGYSVLFSTAAQLLLDLAAQDSPRALERRLRHYCRPALLVIDEVGYLNHDNRSADLLFEIASRRYEKKSIVLTTNLPFRDWPTVFPNAACVTALIERLIHHADVVPIEGDSYRRRDAEASNATKTERSTKKRA